MAGRRADLHNGHLPALRQRYCNHAENAFHRYHPLVTSGRVAQEQDAHNGKILTVSKQ